MKQMAQELSLIDEITDKYGDDKSSLIQVLLALQKKYNWLSEDVLKLVSEKLDIPLSQVYHIATFYKAFSLEPRGEHLVSVCVGTACQVRGATQLLDKVVDALKVRPGQTSRDMRFSLETVSCIGCCALGPVMVVDGEYIGKPTTKDIDHIATIQ
jgi:NADH-quinone oxidoreductase subunit E